MEEQRKDRDSSRDHRKHRGDHVHAGDPTLCLGNEAIGRNVAIHHGQFLHPAIVIPSGPSAVKFRFIDLFAGIGGFRLGLERLGGKCVFSCERDPFSAKTYESWFGESPLSDINDIVVDDIPDHDSLAAGFPCQPFSVAGVSKKRSLGQPNGFACQKQGNLFFRILDIARIRRSPVLILENVKNLKSHDGRRTWHFSHQRGT